MIKTKHKVVSTVKLKYCFLALVVNELQQIKVNTKHMYTIRIKY